MKISIIIPCYNIEQHLQKCIDSVLNQTYSNFELLLLNDGSTDNTLQVCKEFKEKDSRVRVFSHQNKGVSYTRNRGLKMAKGEAVMFIDGDDYVKPDYLKTLFDAFEKENLPICGIINVRGEKMEPNTNFLNLIKLHSAQDLGANDFMRLLEFEAYSTPTCRVYSKNVIDKHNIHFDETLSYQEDLLFNINYSYHIKNIKILDYFGYYYIEHNDSSTIGYHDNFDHIPALYSKLNKMVNNKQDEVVLQEFIFQTSLRKISNIFHKNSLKSGREKLLELKETLNSDYFKFSSNHVFKSDLNMLLKCLLQLKNANLIFIYFKVLH